MSLQFYMQTIFCFTEFIYFCTHNRTLHQIEKKLVEEVNIFHESK